MSIIAARQALDTKLSRREVTRNCAVKIVLKHTQSGTVIQMEVRIHTTDVSYKPNPQHPCTKMSGE
jgi:hypothetical protein